MILFGIHIKAKCDPIVIDKLSVEFLETELDLLDKAIKQHIGGSNIEHLISHLLSWTDFIDYLFIKGII